MLGVVRSEHPVPRSPSWRARVLDRVARFGFRPLAALLPLNNVGICAARRLVAWSMAAGAPTLRGSTVISVRDGDVRGDWVAAPGVEFGHRAIYYVHGSGYVICSARTHRGLALRLSRATGLPVFLTDYRLAPEYRFPTAAEDVERGYQWLLERGFRGTDLVVAADSAGGHLAVDLFNENGRQSRPQPAAAVLFSPLLDPTFGLAGEQEQLHADPLISAANARAMVELYTGGQPPESPRLCLPINAGTAFPPMLVQAGGAEMLSADARRLAELVSDAGGRCHLQIWPGQLHVFQALPLLIPEASQAIEYAAQFVAEVFSDALVQPHDESQVI